MNENKYLPQEALTFYNYEDAAIVQRKLIEAGYCVLMSREETLWLLNWVWTPTPADRNGVVLFNREEYEDWWWNFYKDHPELNRYDDTE